LTVSHTLLALRSGWLQPYCLAC